MFEPNVDWNKWEKFSRDGQFQDSEAPGECSCQLVCECFQKDLEEWLADVLHVRKCVPRPGKSVNKNDHLVINEAGILQGPYLFEEWLEYSYILLDKFHDILNGKEIPDWTQVYFRSTQDYYSGSYNDFSQIFLILCEKID